MKWAILSDVHGNLEALQAVLKETEAEGVERLACLGDVVGYGADPDACLLLLREQTDLFVAGNHDWGAVGLTDISYFNPVAKTAILWTARILTEGSRIFLRGLPLARELNELTFIHASPRTPEEWNYIFTSPAAEKEFRAMAGDLAFFGHTHLPLVWVEEPGGKVKVVEKPGVVLEPGRRYMINVGSVGQPRDGHPLAAYGLYDDDLKRFLLKRVPYDIPRTQGQILQAGLPSSLAHRLAQGW